MPYQYTSTLTVDTTYNYPNGSPFVLYLETSGLRPPFVSPQLYTPNIYPADASVSNYPNPFNLTCNGTSRVPSSITATITISDAYFNATVAKYAPGTVYSLYVRLTFGGSGTYFDCTGFISLYSTDLPVSTDPTAPVTPPPVFTSDNPPPGTFSPGPPVPTTTPTGGQLFSTDTGPSGITVSDPICVDSFVLGPPCAANWIKGN